MIMVTVQVADLSDKNFKSSRVMRWRLSRLSSRFGAKLSRERKPKLGDLECYYVNNRQSVVVLCMPNVSYPE